MKQPTDPDELLLRAAADPTRMAILRELAAGERVCACDFASCCEVAQPTISHHLKTLKSSGWVRAERRGSFIYYELRPEAAARFAELAGQLSLGAQPARPPSARSLPVIQSLA